MKQILLFQFLLIFLFTFSNSFQFKFENENEFDWIQEEILISNDGKDNDWFGTSIDMKGNICVIGSPYSSEETIYEEGKAYIFQNNGTNWNQSQILIASDAQVNDQFGSSVSISNDGKIILIGAPNANVSLNQSQGKSYIFENNGTFWNEKQILISSDGEEYDGFGTSVSISQNICVIGTYQANVGNNSAQGKAYIFENNGTFWNQKQILIASDGKTEDQFGATISISNDSSFLVIGAPYANIGQNIEQGKAYIFQNNGTFWNQKQILIASDGEAEDSFSWSVSISNDGKFVFIGAAQSDVGDNEEQGKAYIFQNNGTFWNQSQILITSDGQSMDHFGWISSISNDSHFALIGAPSANVGNNEYQGKAYIFENNGTFWNQYQVLISNDGESMDQFGVSVSISNDISLIGASWANVGNDSQQGKVYVFELNLPQVNILNCSSLFSSFECYWNQINSTLNDIEYQINYQNEIQNWELIQYPILNQNILYQIFNSSIYSNISGNVDYSIQIKSCITLTQICGNFSNQINLTTRIDSVKNLNYKSYSNSIQLNWNYPNVPIINSIPKLNHYIISYQILNSNQSTNISISNSSTSFQINNLQSLTNYLISIYSCRNEECYGNDKGEITTIQIQTKQQNSTSKSKSNSKTTIIVISILIPIIVIISIILIIFLIKKKKTKNENKFKPTTDQGDVDEISLFSDYN